MEQKVKAIHSNEAATSEERMQKIQSAYDKAMIYLAQRDHSELELKRKLSLKGFDEIEIQQVLEKLNERKWIPAPEVLSEKYASNLHRQRRGHIWINSKLRLKGLPPIHEDENLEKQKAESFLRSKGIQLEEIKQINRVEKSKIARQLQYRGFSRGTISVILFHEG